MPWYGAGMSFGSIGLRVMLARARAARRARHASCPPVRAATPTSSPSTPTTSSPRWRPASSACARRPSSARGWSRSSTRRAPSRASAATCWATRTPRAVAREREAVQGTSLFSPFPFHSVYSVEDHKKHIDWLKQINPRALISVKVSTPTDVDMVAVGSYFAGAHIVHLDGAYGGTGAAPEIAKKNIAMPIEYAIPKVHRFLLAEGLRDEITLMASGGIRTAYDVAKAIALGADGCVIGTAELVAIGCSRLGSCEQGLGCPVRHHHHRPRAQQADRGRDRLAADLQPLRELAEAARRDPARARHAQRRRAARPHRPAGLPGVSHGHATDSHRRAARTRAPACSSDDASADRRGRATRPRAAAACSGFAANVPIAGRHVLTASRQMHNRGNGKGGGIAAAGLDPAQMRVSPEVLRTHYLLQIAYLDPGCARARWSASAWRAASTSPQAYPVDDRRGLARRRRAWRCAPPEVVRYFCRVKPEVLARFAEQNALRHVPARAVEDEFVYQNSFRLNQRYYASLGQKRAFVAQPRPRPAGPQDRRLRRAGGRVLPARGADRARLDRAPALPDQGPRLAPRRRPPLHRHERGAGPQRRLRQLPPGHRVPAAAQHRAAVPHRHRGERAAVRPVGPRLRLPARGGRSRRWRRPASATSTCCRRRSRRSTARSSRPTCRAARTDPGSSSSPAASPTQASWQLLGHHRHLHAAAAGVRPLRERTGSRGCRSGSSPPSARRSTPACAASRPRIRALPAGGRPLLERARRLVHRRRRVRLHGDRARTARQLSRAATSSATAVTVAARGRRAREPTRRGRAPGPERRRGGLVRRRRARR